MPDLANVVGMYANGESIWAITSPLEAQAAPKPPVALFVSDNSEATWHSVGPIPTVNGSVIGAARTGPVTGYVLVDNAESHLEV